MDICASVVSNDGARACVLNQGFADTNVRSTPSMPQYSTVSREGIFTIVTLNRPEALNAMHPPGNLELAGIFDEFEADAEQWVAIVTGAGRAFSAGLDLKFTAAAGQLTPVPMGFAGLTSRYEITKPIIAAINGPALGGGFEAALACDVIIAAEDAFFALPEPKVGLAALAGGLLRLPQSIGLHRALGIILTGRRVSAREGFELGFVNQVVAADELISTARHWASLIAECSPLAVRASKQVVRHGLGKPINGELEKVRQLAAVQAMLTSKDAIEGPLAFAQKRRPVWQGR